MRYIVFIKNIGVKLLGILQTVQGWVVAGLLFLLDFIAGHELAVGLVVAVTLMDAIWGITVSIKRKKFALSELARLTVGKLAVYGCAMLAFIGLDRLIGMTLTASVIGAAITLVELWSASASMLILFPNFLFLKLLRKALTGEIASKLNVAPEEVEEFLKQEEQRLKTKKETINELYDPQSKGYGFIRWNTIKGMVGNVRQFSVNGGNNIVVKWIGEE